MIIYIDAEKAFEKSAFYHDKTFYKWGIEEPYLKIIKAIYDTSTDNIILNGEKLKVIPLNLVQVKNAHFHYSYSTQY